MDYYTSVVILLFAALVVLCILVRQNARMSDLKKRSFCASFCLLAMAILAEWLGVRCSGSPAVPAWLLRAIKCADYILTPMVGGSLAVLLRGRRRWQKLMVVVLGANTAFQLVSAFTEWMIRIDEYNRYSHGPLYWVYIVCYLGVIVLAVAEFLSYGKRFHSRNRISMYAIMAFLLLGIALQELLGNEHRTAYITLTVGMAMMYIHYTEFSQLAADEHIQQQQILITTDPLTGVLSRNAYAADLRRLDAAGMPGDQIAFAIDINGLKEVNDTHGHEAGDELICGAADCIVSVFEPWGSCYRTGGDEFVVLARMEPGKAAEALKELSVKTAAWKGSKAGQLSLSAGWAAASDHPDLGAEKLVNAADKAMYAEKAAYYQVKGNDRRQR